MAFTTHFVVSGCGQLTILTLAWENGQEPHLSDEQTKVERSEITCWRHTSSTESGFEPKFA